MKDTLLARATLTDPEFAVWITKHAQGLGRRSGSLTLGISEEAWRYRLRNAEAKMETARKERAA